MRCSWDEIKGRANATKHGVDFADACRMFEEPTIAAPDRRWDYGEGRIGAFGVVDGTVLFVVYTWRGHVRRLIGARRASTHERKVHFETVAAQDGRA
jgi:uncharacterized DUF497 family protein